MIKSFVPSTVELRYNEVCGVHGFDPRYIRGEGYNAGRKKTNPPPLFRQVETPPPPHFRGWPVSTFSFMNVYYIQYIHV